MENSEKDNKAKQYYKRKSQNIFLMQLFWAYLMRENDTDEPVVAEALEMVAEVLLAIVVDFFVLEVDDAANFVDDALVAAVVLEDNVVACFEVTEELEVMLGLDPVVVELVAY